MADIPWYKNQNLYSGLGDIGSAIFSGENYKNPSDASMDFLKNIPKEILPYLQPYIEGGKNAMGQAMGQYGKLINNPGQTVNEMGSSYHQSPGYNFAVDQATKAANNASAAGGMAGSPQEQQQLAGTVTGLANQDYYNYLSNVLGQYDLGLGGLGKTAELGSQAAENYGTDIGNADLSEAMMKYRGTQEQNQQNSGIGGMISSAIQMLGPLLLS